MDGHLESFVEIIRDIRQIEQRLHRLTVGTGGEGSGLPAPSGTYSLLYSSNTYSAAYDEWDGDLPHPAAANRILLTGAANFSWVDVTTALPAAGAAGQVQYNNGGVFAGAAGFEYQAAASPNVTIQAQNAAYVPLLLKGAAAQSANLQELQDSAGNVLSGVDERGVLFSDADTDETNFFAGSDAGNSSATGTSNVLIGKLVGKNLTTGAQNVALGHFSMGGNTAVALTGSRNFALGHSSMRDVTAGLDNIGIGNGSLQDITSGDGNTGIGTNAMWNLTTSNYNVGIGQNAGYTVITGWGNVAVGVNSLFSGTGSYNVGIGHQAGKNQTTGSNNVFIGVSSGPTAATALSNDLYIHNAASATPLIHGHFDGVGGHGLMTYVPAAAAVGFIIKGAAAQSANLLELQESDGSIMLASGDGLDGSEFIINEQGEDIDFRVEGNTEDHLLTVDAGADAVRLGDWDTNYAQFAIDGELTLVGTARVKQEFGINAISLAPGSTGPDPVILGNSIGYSYDIGDDSVMNWEVPYGCDTSEDIKIEVYWYINEAYVTNSGEVQWRIQWSACPANETEAIDAPTHTGTIDFGDQDVPATAKFLTEVSGTIAAASIDDGDLVSMTLDRVALDGGANPTADPVIVWLEVEYTKNKLGVAT